MFEDGTDGNRRSQVGIGTLIVFIAMVLVAAIAAGVLITTSGVLQSKSEQAGERSSAKVTNRLEPASKIGTVNNNDEVETVEMVLQKSPGADDINVSAATVEFVGPDGTDRFALDQGSTVASISELQDDEGSLEPGAYVLNDPVDRAVLELDLTATTTNSPLDPGETATVRINTQDGSVSIVRLSVPETLAGKASVGL